VWKKVVHVDRLLQLFKYVPREQLTIPDFGFQVIVPIPKITKGTSLMSGIFQKTGSCDSID
ncbi:hypothetical protein PIB30_076670, partial [Stylosanthes scabra]|nr:hypothetical protein [Stylosanthes scabra]